MCSKPLFKFNNLMQKINQNRSWNYNISVITRSPKLTLFYLIQLSNNKSTQVKMTTQEDEKISFYTFPHDVCSQCLHEGLSCAKAKALRECCANTYKATTVMCDCLNGSFRKYSAQINMNPGRLLVYLNFFPVSGRHLHCEKTWTQGNIFDFVTCYFKMHFPWQLFLPSFIVESFLLTTIKKLCIIGYLWSPHHSRFSATPFARIISGRGIICGSRIICGPVQIQCSWNLYDNLTVA